jgi:uncharacterized protein YkwD
MTIRRTCTDTLGPTRSLATALAALVVVVGAVVALASPSSAAPAAPAAASGPEALMLDLVNGERAAHGLPALAWRDDVAGIAAAWSATMAATGVFAHNDDYFSSATRALLGAATRGENVSTSDGIEVSHASLMNSPPHRANILSTEFTQIGIGAFQDASGRWWLTPGYTRPAGGSAPAPAPAPAPEPVEAAPVPEPDPVPVVEAAPVPAPAAPVTEPPTTLAPTTVPPTTAAPVPPPVVQLAASPPVLTDTATDAGAFVPTGDDGRTPVPTGWASVAAAAALLVLGGHAMRARAISEGQLAQAR